MNSALRCSNPAVSSTLWQICSAASRAGYRRYSTALSFNQSFSRLVHRRAAYQPADPLYITLRSFHRTSVTRNEQQQAVSATSESRRLKLEENLAKANDALAAERFDEAEIAYHSVLQLMDLLDYSPEDRVQPYAGIAFALHCQGKHSDAAHFYDSSLKILRDSGKGAGIEYGITLLNYAELLSVSDDIEGAERTCKEALPLLEGSSADHYAGALSNLATYLSVQNRFEEALEYSQKAVDIFDKTLGHDNEYTLSAVRGNVRILQDLGRQEDADALIAKFEEHRSKVSIDTTSEMDNELMAKFRERLDQEKERKSVDPEGLMSDEEMKQRIFKEFAAQAQDSGLGEQEQLDQLKSKLFQAKSSAASAINNGTSQKRQEDEDEELEKFANQGYSIDNVLKKVYSMKLEELQKEIAEFHETTSEEFKKYAVEKGIVQDENEFQLNDNTQLDSLEKEIEEAGVDEEDDDAEEMTEEEFQKFKESMLGKHASMEDIYKVLKGAGSEDFLSKDLEDLENSIEDD